MHEIGSEQAGYRLDGVLGRGGMGVVYEATQLSLERPVALKVLSLDHTGDDAFRERFRREGKRQAALDHPGIVTVYESGETDDGSLFIAMKLIRGGTLLDLIQAGGLQPARAMRMLRPVAEALDVAHEAGLIHRDVKPQNVLVDARDNAYLCDFGLVRDPQEAGLTRTGVFVGTLDYIAPEQIRAESPVPASDIYSFAAVLYEMLTGDVPFPRETEEQTLFAHMSDAAPSARDVNPALPPETAEALVRGMAKDPGDRPATAVGLLEAAAAPIEAAVAPADSGTAAPAARSGESAETVVSPRERPTAQ